MSELAQILSGLKNWLLVQMPAPSNELFRAWVGRKGVLGIWILRIILVLSITGFMLAIFFPLDSLSFRFLALGPSLELLGLLFLSSAALTIFARPSRPEIQAGDVHLAERTSDDDITVMLSYSISLILALPKLRAIPFGRLRVYLGAIGFAFVTIGIILQIVGALLS